MNGANSLKNCDILKRYIKRYITAALEKPIKAPPLSVDYFIRYFYLTVFSTISFLFFETIHLSLLLERDHRFQIYCTSGITLAKKK